MKEKIVIFLMWLSVYFSPVFPLIFSIGFFVICDAITGVIASKKRKEPFTSKKLRDSIYKFIEYGVGILVAHIIERQFIPDLPALKLIAGFCAYIELKSINENIEKSSGINIFKMILEKIKTK